ncbi:MAG: Rrf2 family transcriptional regulator [Ruminococcus sp.]|nr:Rrf2 family transcriptional regulator [Ruminococcus sp.]
MRVSKRFPMAVHSVLFVAVHSPIRRVTSTLVAESIEANPVTIRTLFLDLSEKGILETTAGKNGGVRMKREPKDITLWDIYQAVETDDIREIFKIYEGNCACPIAKNLSVVLYSHMASAVEAMKAEMEKVIVEALIAELKEKTL